MLCSVLLLAISWLARESKWVWSAKGISFTAG
jgi:hypothetical protein